MKTPLAWRNLLHDKRRTMAAASGVAFAILLVFMQIGFYTACLASATLIYDLCDFDVILLAKPYVHLRSSGAIPKARLYQALATPGVASVAPVYVNSALWRNTENGVGREILVLGVNPADRPFRATRINRDLGLLARPDTVIMDQVARPLVGPHAVGTITELNGRRIEVVGEYRQGAGLIADGAALTSDLTFSRLMPRGSLDRVELGLVRLAASADPQSVLAQLRVRLPDDTLVWSRAQVNAREQYFFTRVKPMGFMFTSGVLIGLVVGGVILYQILSADIANQIPQYATLKAIGYGRGYFYRVVMTEGLLFAVLGYLPALVLSWGLYGLVRTLAQIPMYLTPPCAALVLGLSVAMCVLSGLLAIRKVNAADPAELF
jgi:putative ABC transport system permease protein